MSNAKTYTFHVDGMHCQSCVLMTESELKKVLGISYVKASLNHLNVEVTGILGTKNRNTLREI